MSTKMSKNGVDFFQVDDAPDSIKVALDKGYKPYIDVTKNGKDIYTIEGNEGSVTAAISKGYTQVGDWKIKNEAKKPSYFESSARGGVQGVSLGFSDEAMAATHAAGLDEIEYDDMGMPIRSTLPDGTKHVKGDVQRKYVATRDAERAKNQEAQEANPDTYLAGNIAGGVLLPGSSAKAIMGQGAAMGLGNSEAEDLTGMAKDTAIGLGAGAAGIGVAKAVGTGTKYVAEKIPDAAKKTARSMVKHGLDVPEDVIKAIEADDGILKAAKNAKSVNELTDVIEEGVKNTQGKISKLDSKAWDHLDYLDYHDVAPTLGKDPGSMFHDVGGQLIEEFKLEGSNQAAQKSALKALQSAMDDAKAVKTFTDIKELVQSIDKNINWDSPSDSLKNSVLQRFRTELDKVMKSYEPYEDAMKGVSELTDSLSQVKNKMGLKPAADELGGKTLQASDRTTTQLQTQIRQALDDKGKFIREKLDAVVPGVRKDLEAASLKQALEKDTARGSRSTIGYGTVFGTLGLLGGVTSGGVLAGLGAASGYARDKFGREIGANIIQSLEHGGFGKVIDKFPQYSKVLVDAAARGESALALTHYLLMKKDELYKVAFESP